MGRVEAMSTAPDHRQQHAEILQRLPHTRPWSPTALPRATLPPGVHPIRHHGDRRRIAEEVAIVWHDLPEWLAQYPPLKWGRERLVVSASDVVGVVVAHSVTASGRHVRHWWIRRTDPTAPAYTGPERACPHESAWLATIRPGEESEPAWLHLRPDA